MNFGEWFRRARKHELLPVIECSLTDCTNRTRKPYDIDPRKRWMVQIKLQEEDGSQVTMNLCPKCIKKFFPSVNEEFFERMENSERLIRLRSEKAELN
jgi:hypothetical protein